MGLFLGLTACGDSAGEESETSTSTSATATAEDTTETGTTGSDTPQEAMEALLACGLPEPCGAVVYLDGENCCEPPPELTQDEICIFTELRDRNSAHISVIYGNDPDEWANNYTQEDLFIWSDGSATMLRDPHFNGQTESGLMDPQSAQLMSVAFFSNCLTTTDADEIAHCRSATHWYESTGNLDGAECL